MIVFQKKIFIITIFSLILLSLLLYRSLQKNEIKVDSRNLKATPTSVSDNNDLKKKIPVADISESVFVPYWEVTSLSLKDISQFDTMYYFGITPNKTGIDSSEDGFKNLNLFAQHTSGKKTILTLRLLNNEINQQILSDESFRTTILNETISLAKSYQFSGIAIDLEISGFSLTDSSKQVTQFYKDACLRFTETELSCTAVIFGDTVYRSRPYDINTISQYADSIIIMAYDFHKSRGEPGPNFPLSGKAKFGYDFETMLADFTKTVDPSKIQIAFGMFGYDWTLGKQGLPLHQARARSLLDMEEMFSPCDLASCTVERDIEAGEKKVQYTDEEGNDHEVWFEDFDSVKLKKEAISELGIGRIVYWSYGYF